MLLSSSPIRASSRADTLPFAFPPIRHLPYLPPPPVCRLGLAVRRDSAGRRSPCGGASKNCLNCQVGASHSTRTRRGQRRNVGGVNSVGCRNRGSAGVPIFLDFGPYFLSRGSSRGLLELLLAQTWIGLAKVSTKNNLSLIFF
jgi:hypothetical protein